MQKLSSQTALILLTIAVTCALFCGCSKTANTGPGQVVQTTIYDFESLRFRYYWLFDPFTDSVWATRSARGDSIVTLKLYRTADFDIADTEPLALALPTVPPGATIEIARSHPDSLYSDWQRKANMQLVEETDYSVEARQFWLTLSDHAPISEATLLGYYALIQTPTGIDTIGASADSVQMGRADSVSLILQMLKSDNRQDPTHPTWLLEWKNVYDLGVRDFDWERVNVDVCVGRRGAPCDTRFSANGTPFKEILGLDRVSADGCTVPDGWIDDAPLMLDRQRGHVTFPNSFPFAPTTYPILSTGYPINLLGDRRSYANNRDTLTSETPGIYSGLTAVNRQEASTFRLIVTRIR